MKNRALLCYVILIALQHFMHGMEMTSNFYIKTKEVKILQHAIQYQIPSLQVLCVKKIDWQKKFSAITSKNIDEKVRQYSDYVDQAIYEQKRVAVSKKSDECTVKNNKTDNFDVLLDDFGKILTVKFRTLFPFPDKVCFFTIDDVGKIFLQDQLIDMSFRIGCSIIPKEKVLFFVRSQNRCTIYNCDSHRKKNLEMKAIKNDLLKKRYVLCKKDSVINENKQIQLYDNLTDSYKPIYTTLNPINYSLVSDDGTSLILYSRNDDQWHWQLWLISDMSLKMEGIIDQFIYPPQVLNDNKVRIYHYPRDIYLIHDLEKNIFYDQSGEIKIKNGNISISRPRVSTNLKEEKVLQLQPPPDSALFDLIKSTDTYQYYMWGNSIIFQFNYGIVILDPETQEFRIIATTNKEQSYFDDILYNPLHDILIVAERSIHSNWIKLHTFKLLVNPIKIATKTVLDRVLDQTETNPEWSLQELQTLKETKTYQENIEQSTKQAVDDLIEYLQIKLEQLKVS